MELGGGGGLVVEGLLDGVEGGAELGVGVLEPIGDPEAVEGPTLVLEDGLAEAVAVAGAGGGAVGGAVAFDAEEVAAGLSGVGDGEVDVEAGDADVAVDEVAVIGEGGVEGVLEGSGWQGLGVGGVGPMSGFGEMEEGAEGLDAAAGGAVEVDVVGADGGEDGAATAGAGDEDVEAAFAAFGAEGAEVHAEEAVGVAAVADGDEDGVAFVALDVFEVFDEERFVGVGVEERFGVGVFAAEQFEFVEDGLLLADGEGGDAEGLVGVSAGVVHDGAADGLGFDAVGAGAAAVEDAVADDPELEAEGVVGGEGAWGDEEAVVVEFAVGDGDEGVVAGAVVPAEHGGGEAAGGAEAEDAFDVLDAGGAGVGGRFGILAGDAGEEAGGGELSAVADDDDLACAGDGAEGVDGLDLAGFVDDEEVEVDGVRGEELGDGEGAHHEDRFDGLDDGAGVAEQLADGAVASFAFQFGGEDAHGADAGVDGGHAGVVGGEDAVAGDVEAIAVEAAEFVDEAGVGGAVEAGEGGVEFGQFAEDAGEAGAAEGWAGVGGWDGAVGEGVGEGAEAEVVGEAGAGAVVGPGEDGAGVLLAGFEALLEEGEGDGLDRLGAEGLGGVEAEA